jgi:hypothetical protein
MGFDYYSSIKPSWFPGEPLPLSIIIIAGGIVGILINYFSDVLPVYRNLTQPSCDNCGRKFPLPDYIIFYRCSQCGSKRPIRSIVVVIVSMIMCVFLKFFPFSGLGFFASLPILIFMAVIVVIDIEHRLVLIQTSIFGLFLFLVYGAALNDFSTTMMGGFVGFLIMLFFYLKGKIFIHMIGKIRKKEINEIAFGLGDVIFGTILGFLVGYPLIIGAIILSMLLLVVVSFFLFLFLFLSRKYHAFSMTLPFTTFQVIGAIAILYMQYY